MKKNKLAFEKLRVCSASLPGATQNIKFGSKLVFSVGGKMFAIARNDGIDVFSFKVDDDRFLELTDIPGIIPAPYLARAKWIQVGVECKLSLQDMILLVQRSHQIVFSKLPMKLQREIKIESGNARAAAKHAD